MQFVFSMLYTFPEHSFSFFKCLFLPLFLPSLFLLSSLPSFNKYLLNFTYVPDVYVCILTMDSLEEISVFLTNRGLSLSLSPYIQLTDSGTTKVLFSQRPYIRLRCHGKCHQYVIVQAKSKSFSSQSSRQMFQIRRGLCSVQSLRDPG